MAVTVTFIRHGESEDNPRGVWAGWKDAPLSKLGRTQAAALGQYLSPTKIDIIYASDLLRANSTGQAVHAGQHSGPHNHQPDFVTHPKLREQHFGIAEGHPWVLETPPNKSYAELFDEKIFPVLFERHEKFPEGESLDDLSARAKEAVAECILPHVVPENVSGGYHIALASHGLAISELVSALLRLDPTAPQDVSYTGLLNTAWTRVHVSLQDAHEGPIDPSNPPPLKVEVVEVNKADHLADIAPPSILDPEEVDEQQAEARAFFGGGGKAAGAKTT